MRRFRPFELHGGTAAHGPWDICDYPGGCSPTERARRAPNRTIHGAAMMKLPGTALTCPSSPIRPITCGGKITAAASASPGPGCTPPSGYFLPASDRPFRESLHVANRSHPRQRVVAKYLARWGHRFRVVQGADMKDHQAWPGSRLLGNRRAAFRAEMSQHRLPAAARASERLRHALDRQCLLRHINQSGECAASESLAVSAMAYTGRQRFGRCPVAHLTAEATAPQHRHYFLLC